MKLYYSKGACSLAVRIIINEIGMDCSFEAVDLTSKKTESGQDFMTINRKGAVPVLQLENGQVLTENAVIMQYIADANHAYHVLPKIGDFKRYVVLESLNYASSEVHKTMGMLFNPLVTPEIRDNLIIPSIKSKLSYLSHCVEQNDFICGNHFTLADAYIFVMLLWTFHFTIDLKQWPALMQYFDRLSKHPSVLKSLKQESITI